MPRPGPGFPREPLNPRRKGIGRFVIEAVGRPAHAAVSAEKGVSAILELQHQIDGPHLPLPSSLLDRMGGYTDAAQELTRSELDFLRHAREMCGTVVCALTKTDFYPAWRTVRDLNQGHLPPLLPERPPIPPPATGPR